MQTTDINASEGKVNEKLMIDVVEKDDNEKDLLTQIERIEILEKAKVELQEEKISLVQEIQKLKNDIVNIIKLNSLMMQLGKQ